VRWTGRITPLYSQTYTFYVGSDDGVRLWVDGRLIVNNWTVHNLTTNTGTIALTAGQSYSIKLEYFNDVGSAVCRLLWSSSSQAKSIVPESQLSCTGYSPVVANGIYCLPPKLATSKAMEVKSGGTADGTVVDINNWTSKTYQKWMIVSAGGDYFKLVPQHATSKVLDVNGGYTTNATKVQIWSNNGMAQQQFKLVDMGQGWFKLQPQHAPTMVLEIKGGATANGTVVQLYQDTGADAQRWRLDRQ
jgi:hypothetical protein